MPLKTRGSGVINKAQRRLANLKSIEENLDLGYGLTVKTYEQRIEQTRQAIEDYNTLISNLDESRRTVTELESLLSELSERMLTGVATKYGRNSKQYSKAGGSIRKGKRLSSASFEMVADSQAALPTGTLMQPSANSTNGSTNNQPALN